MSDLILTEKSLGFAGQVSKLLLGRVPSVFSLQYNYVVIVLMFMLVRKKNGLTINII
jgi:hypothetical protein